VTLDGVKFRFFDTAGIREAEDQIEAIGVARTLAKMEQAAIILYLFDLQQTSPSDLKAELSQMKKHNAEVLLVGNKLDAVSTSYLEAFADFENLYFISAKESTGLKDLENELLNRVYAGQLQDETVVANARHVEALSKAKLALEAAVNAFGNQLPTDLVAQEIRLALHYLGEITGEVTTDDLLGNIFSKFCIGK
jgi:tRNA modification GTPase